MLQAPVAGSGAFRDGWTVTPRPYDPWTPSNVAAGYRPEPTRHRRIAEEEVLKSWRVRTC